MTREDWLSVLKSSDPQYNRSAHVDEYYAVPAPSGGGDEKKQGAGGVSTEANDGRDDNPEEEHHMYAFWA